jgi:signal transduction histidine kinase
LGRTVTSILNRLPGAFPAPGNDNVGMPQPENLAILRSIALIYVGASTFTSAWPGARDGAAEIAVFAAATIILALWTVAETWPPGGERWQGLLARRYDLLPWAFGIIAVASGAISVLRSGGNFILLAVVAVAVISGRRQAAGWMVTMLAIAAIEAVGLPTGARGWVTLAYPGAVLVGLLLGLNRRAHHIQVEQAAALTARSEQLRDEQARTAALDERARIAREIHDVLAHSLGALGVQIQLAQAVLTDTHDEARAVELLDQARRITTDGLAETRRAVHALRGQTPPLAEGLAELSAEHQRRHGSPVAFQVIGEPRPLSPDAGLALTRTAQEALVNAAKHAPRRPVRVSLDYAEAGTSLVVTSQLREPGGGENEQPALVTVNGGYGLTGMRERLLLLDGTLSAGPRGSDWVVEARVPR